MSFKLLLLFVSIAAVLTAASAADLATAQEPVILRGPAGAVVAIAFSPDGKTLATSSYDKTVRIWDLASGETITTFPGRVVTFSPDGKILASSSNGSEEIVGLWDVTRALERKPHE